MRIAYEKQIAALQAIIQNIVGVFVIAMTVIILFSINKTSAARVSNTYISYVIDRLKIIRSRVNMSTRMGRENNDSSDEE